MDITTILRRLGPMQAGELTSTLGVSRATLNRHVKLAGSELISLGQARRTTYAARRPLRGSTLPLPLFQIDSTGLAKEVAQLSRVHPDGTAVEFLRPVDWPLDDSMADGWFEGLPYFLQDMRPQGFLGRHFARRYAAVLQVTEDPTTWSDDDALHVMSVLGDDLPGNLLVGEASCRLWLDHVQAVQSEPSKLGIGEERVIDDFAQLATAALSTGIIGSSAGGEFPKFTALRQRPDGTAQHVLVKFSGADASPGAQRWADLLICEHLAAQVVAETLGLPASRSRILQGAGRTFLEVDRFDRQGVVGRSPVVSWFALNAAMLGQLGKPWPDALAALQPMKWLTRDTVDQVSRLWWFGQLIGNTDMHDGNLSFIPKRDAASASLALAPVYDMLPMAYAPVRGVELPTWTYQPRLPLPAQSAAWTAAAKAATVFWDRARQDPRISAAFREICATNLQRLRTLTASMGM